MDSKDRMKVKDLASQVGKDVELIRSKLSQMGHSTFSAESEISIEACEKIYALYPKKDASAKTVSTDNSESSAPRGVVRRVVRREQPQESAPAAPAPAQDVAPATEAPKVRRRPAVTNTEEAPVAPKAEEPKVAPAPKAEEAPKAPEAPKAVETPKVPEEPTAAPAPAPKAEEPKVAPAPKATEKKIRSAGMASSNESFTIDLGGNAVSAKREEFDRARLESANKPRVRRETGTNNAMTRRTERQTQDRQANQNRFQNNRDGGFRDGGFKKPGGFDRNGGFDKGGFDKDKDSDYSKERRTQSPNKAQGQKAASFEHVEPNLETRREKTGDKDSTKKDKRIEGSRNEAGTRRSGGSQGAKEGKYNSARQFIGDKMDVSEVESFEFNYNGNFDVNSSRVRKQVNKKKDKEADEARKEAQKLTHVEVPPVITVKEFGELIKKSAADVIKKLFMLGIMATVNAEIDFDTACLVANEFEIEATPAVVVTDEEILLEDPNDEELGEDAVSRPPVVVVMGHVDHGKTSLLDAIRNTSVTSGEAGGITQHIGAYTVTLKDHKITFLDTPGHEAFTAMRARGAQVTDVAIIVVAADDGVMPQTIEAINHAKAANVSIVVAVNKIDKEGANIERVKTEMAEQNVVCEDWGGDVPFIPVSAKKGENIDTLLETVLLSADILDLKASPTKQCKGTVIEAKLDKNKGPVATLLVQRGTLRSGDAILTESTFGHIRTMVNDKGRTIKEAGPSTPVEVTGLPEVPEAGKVFYVVNKDEKLAKKVAEDRMSQMRQTTMTYSNKVTLEGLFSQMQAGEVKDLNIIVKADVKGSAEAIKASLEKLSNDEVRVCVIHNGVGGVSESDVLLAEASNAVIIGFNVRPIGGVGEIAAEKGVDMKLYRIIYDAIDDVKAAMVGMLKPEFKENVIGHVEIRQTFKISGVGTIAGGYVTDGKVVRNSKARIVRDSIVIYEGNLASLKRFKDDVKEVAAGYECGLSFEKFDDLKEGDVIESYVMEEIARTL